MKDEQLHARIKAFLDKNYPCCDTKGCCGEEEEAWAIIDIIKDAGYAPAQEAHDAGYNEACADIISVRPSGGPKPYEVQK